MSDIKISGTNLFERVVFILEQAKSAVVKAINSNMVLAYWLIGREIVNEIQKGKNRAEYGKQVIENLSVQLLKKYGRGFSTTNIRYFRQFYSVYSTRTPEIRHIGSGEFENTEKHHPTVGLILCSDKDKTIVKYSILSESKQLFASKYMLYLPTEEELVRELEREKRMIAERLKEESNGEHKEHGEEDE